MSVAASVQARLPRAGGLRCPRLDYQLLGVVLCLLAIGLIMVTSASVSIADRQFGQPFYYGLRQAVYLAAGIGAAVLVFGVRMAHWARAGVPVLLLALGLLAVVLVPGVGNTVNGATRWISLGPVNLQVSEPAKLLLFIYLAGYLVRHGEEVRSKVSGFVKPMAVLIIAAALLLAEPDFGATVVLFATALAMMFLAGVRWWQFGTLIGGAGLALAVLAVSSPYRMARLTTFIDPWKDPFDSGFQLTQSLIAIGRGHWFGVGLGGGVQKLFYLPEAHTDFVFAVFAEEFGLVGTVLLMALYAFLVWRAFAIGSVAHKAGDLFSGYLAYGIGTWLALQSTINIGVNMGLLPTKGLTLPLLSYGGSSLVVMCIAIGLLLRIDYETRCSVHTLPANTPLPQRRTPGRKA
ncbi:MAG: putative lipid II flippase FtsW [Gammaproteobacteria bacterium]|jgi:cell division protein FtsW|nr:putative lipid II flippase FtsW [Gammaproteobacteria bacterium]